MNIGIKYVPNEANDWAVTRAIARVIHSEDFAPVVEGRLINLCVKLNESTAGGVRNDGTGVLTLPQERLGLKFLKYIADEPIKIDGRKLKFYKTKPPRQYLVETLAKTPYVDPDIEEEHQKKTRALETKLRVDAVQFGIYYREQYPPEGKKTIYPRFFSIEWEHEYVQSHASLSFEYDRKLIRINVCSFVLCGNDDKLFLIFI